MDAFRVWIGLYYVMSMFQISISAVDVNRANFTAAVYEHAIRMPNISDVPLTREEALRQMKPNVDIFHEVAREAAAKVS